MLKGTLNIGPKGSMGGTCKLGAPVDIKGRIASKALTIMAATGLFPGGSLHPSV